MRTYADNFSYTQFELWNKSRKLYYEQYGLGEDSYESPYRAKGRLFMIALEFGVFDDPDPLLPELIDDVPKLDIFEERIEVLLPEEYEVAVPIVSYIDSTHNTLDAFVEYKTGKHPWTQSDVDSSEQLLFYASVIYLRTGKIPTATLVWVQTEESDSEDLYYTGNFWVFSRTFGKREITSMIKRIAKSINEIHAYEHREYELNDDVVARLFKLKKKRDKLDVKIKMIENDIKRSMEYNSMIYGSSEKATATIVHRSSYKYSEDVAELERKLKVLKEKEKSEGAEKVTSAGNLKITEKNGSNQD